MSLLDRIVDGWHKGLRWRLDWRRCFEVLKRAAP
jgi:hypothetical protein